MVSQWKRELLDNATGAFEGKVDGKAAQKTQEEIDTLYREIGKLTVERDFFVTQARSLSRAQRLALVEPQAPDLSLRRQCQLLGISRSSVYYQRKEPRAYDPELIRLIDEEHLRTPGSGSRRMTIYLNRLGHPVNRKRVQRLMRQMGLQAVYPRLCTSHPGEGRRIYPYLLRGRVINRPNQVWAADVTYLPMGRGFMYLVAIMDWHSRRVLAWRISNTLDIDFSVDAMEDALARHGSPEVFNTDQGCQFTSKAFTDVLEAH